MSISELERMNEEQWLKTVMREIDDQLIRAGGSVAKSVKETIETRKLMWEDYARHIYTFDDAIEIKPHLDEMRRQESRQYFYQRMYRKLEKMAVSPYFGRIDFQESQKAIDHIYIGIASLVDETGMNMIYDWRAPVSGMFYDYELGPAGYHCGVGCIEGRILLKRQYKIKKGRIELMFDTDLRIEDEMLQEILSHSSADERMKTIVTSIQREQNKVIRDQDHQLMIVVGPAGSGKTSIALHRAAYLLYKERETIKAENILVFSPNWIFSEYISNVLPELGEENILQTTFQDYACKILKRNCEERNQQLEYLLTANEGKGYQIRKENICYKSSTEFIRLLDHYLKVLEEREFEDFYFNGQLVISKEECASIFNERYLFFPIAKRLSMVRERFFYLLEPLRRKRVQEIERILADGDEHLEEKELKALARMKVRQEAEKVIAKINRFTYLNYYEAYTQLFTNRTLFNKAAANTIIPDQIKEICSQTFKSLVEKRINYEDLTPLLYLKGKLEGFPRMSGIKYLFIDEAQDYTPLQYRLFKQNFPNSVITILGDLNQLVNPYSTADSIESIAKNLDFPGQIAIRLEKSYRSTREINRFAEAFLPKESRPKADSSIRSGRKPELIRLTAGLDEDITRCIKAFKNDGISSIAVVCKTARTAKIFYDKLKPLMELNLIVDDEGTLSDVPVILPVYLAKGLEFDGVIIPDMDAETYCGESDRKILYTACTRALHRLVIYYQTNLSPLAKGINSNLYEFGNSLRIRD
ncbi:MAG: AAA family ATPase [Firmicutes bacterium]|mgnify:CR=1 FL=1|nr:AAA family ATPase [Bacillota bacterium]